MVEAEPRKVVGTARDAVRIEAPAPTPAVETATEPTAPAQVEGKQETTTQVASDGVFPNGYAHRAGVSAIGKYDGKPIVARFNAEVGRNAVTLVATFDDLPDRVKRVAGGPGRMLGITVGKGEVFVVQDQIQSVEELEATIMYALYGHVRLSWGNPCSTIFLFLRRPRGGCGHADHAQPPRCAGRGAGGGAGDSLGTGGARC